MNRIFARTGADHGGIEMSWTDERVALLRKLWGEGRTAAEIAKELGDITRNAVIGKAHRLKLSNRVSPIQQNNKKPSKPVDDRRDIRGKPAAAVAVPVIAGKGVSLAELKDRMCRWPLGDPKEPGFKFCGGNAVAGLPYCDGHAKVAYQAPGRARVLNPDDLDGFDDAEEVKEAVSA